MGAGFAETGFFFASAMSKRSILRCSCEMGRLGWVMEIFCHSSPLQETLCSYIRKSDCNGQIPHLAEPQRINNFTE